MTPKNQQMGPLGPGKAPVKDPMSGLTGVLAGTLIMEAITVLLILTVILKVDGGEHWTTFNWVYILSLIHISEPTRHFKRSRMPSSA